MAGRRPPGRSTVGRAARLLRPCLLAVLLLGACATAGSRSDAPTTGALEPAHVDPCSLVSATEFSAAAHAVVRASASGLNGAGTVALCPFAGADETASDGTVITDGGFVGLATSVGPLTTFAATYGLPLGPDCSVADLPGVGDAAYVQRCPEYPHTGDVVAWRDGLTVQVEVSGARLTQDAAVAGATDLIGRALARLP
ncbi:MAG: hypothetical protein ACHQZR_08615 [Candidatus Limnocylindrales bacterium]